MKASQPHHDSVADEQAALWAARLDGDTLTAAQRGKLDAWLAEKPTHRALLSSYCQFSADLEEQVPALVAAGAISRPKIKSGVRRRWSFPRIASVALASAAAVAVTVSVMRPPQAIENVATSVAQRKSHTFSDGTRVELNAQTNLRFENTKTERRARLAGGEALFMVAKDPARPFIVQTPNGSVRVTGTTFNVRTDPSPADFEVTVIEGSVQVHPIALGGSKPTGPLLLGPGDQFSTRGSDAVQHVLSETELDDTLAWRRGQIVFRNVPLEEALARYARYHGRSITAAASIAREPIGGRYSIEDLSGFLGALELMLPVKANYDLSGAVSVGPRTGG
jgi:transmembrane sensor